MAQLTLYRSRLCWNLRGQAVYVSLLDRLLYRHPFEGGSARRYARDERPAFGDLDDRLLDRLALSGSERLLDVGCGPGTFARRAAMRHPALTVIAIDPSRDFARGHDDEEAANGANGNGTNGHHRPVITMRAAGEDLPLADASIDVAICLSSIRHVRDRARTFAELRRVVRGTLWIVELDPDADDTRLHAHADHLRSALLRRAFGPLVLRTAPPARAIGELACAAGFTQRSHAVDDEQPVYILELV